MCTLCILSSFPFFLLRFSATPLQQGDTVIVNKKGSISAFSEHGSEIKLNCVNAPIGLYLYE